MLDTRNIFVGTAPLMIRVVKKRKLLKWIIIFLQTGLVSSVNVNNMAHCLRQ